MFIKSKIKYTILFAFAAVLSITGCKKTDSTNTTVTPTGAKLKTVTMLPSGSVTTFYYDSLNRISKVTTSGTVFYQSFVYKGSDSVIVFSSNGTDSGSVNAYKLNGVGLAVNNTSSAGPTTFTYTYDVNGFQTYSTANTVAGSSADTFLISGNNITEHRGSTSNVLTTNTIRVKQVYTFLTDKTNTIGNANKGMSFLGKSSSNLINTEAYHYSSTTIIPPSTTTSDETYNYTYEYDSNSRVTKRTQTAVSTGTPIVENYTYY
ncbi:MAG: hypothetical protein JWN78_621 [Bacteroidota bacterium]|nr:hypothetical protein [Bacteroidota bacterium]